MTSCGVVSRFQSTRPVRGGTRGAGGNAAALIFQSTRPVRGGTACPAPPWAAPGISIHPPRAGRDVQHPVILGNQDISIHPPRAGRDRAQGQHFEEIIISIHPPRAGRDRLGLVGLLGDGHFNPPAPCGAGPTPGIAADAGGGISIHPPRAGRDPGQMSRRKMTSISIHPPRAGRDDNLYCE